MKASSGNGWRENGSNVRERAGERERERERGGLKVREREREGAEAARRSGGAWPPRFRKRAKNRTWW